MAAALCNSSRQERERERKKEKEEGEVDRAEGDKVKPPDGLNPDRMRQMTCVNGGRYRSESFRAPEQKKNKTVFSLSRVVLECFPCRSIPHFLLVVFLRIKSYNIFFLQNQAKPGTF